MSRILQTIKQIVVLLQQRIQDSKLLCNNYQSNSILSLVSQMNSKQNFRYSALIKLLTIIEHSSRQQTIQMMTWTCKYLYMVSAIIFNKMTNQFVGSQKKHDFYHLIALFKKYFFQIDNSKMMNRLNDLFKGRILTKKLTGVLIDTTRQYFKSNINKINTFITSIDTNQYERKKKYYRDQNKIINSNNNKKRSSNILFPLFGNSISNNVFDSENSNRNRSERPSLIKTDFDLKRRQVFGPRNTSSLFPCVIQRTSNKQISSNNVLFQNQKIRSSKPSIYRIPAIISNTIKDTQNISLNDQQQAQPQSQINSSMNTQTKLTNIVKNQYVIKSFIVKSPGKQICRESIDESSPRMRQSFKTDMGKRVQNFMNIYNLDLDGNALLKLMMKKSNQYLYVSYRQSMERNKQILKTLNVKG